MIKLLLDEDLVVTNGRYFYHGLFLLWFSLTKFKKDSVSKIVITFLDLLFLIQKIVPYEILIFNIQDYLWSSH